MSDGVARRLRPPTLVGLGVVALMPFVVLRLKLLPVDDADAFWHILSGQNIWRTRDVVVDDPFGQFSTNTWVQLDWLSDLTMFGLFSGGGYPAISWMYTVLGIVLFALLYLSNRRHAGVLIAGFVAVAAWIGTYASQAYRPQTISFVLLAVFVAVWVRVAQRRGRTPWWLVPLTYVWACCHGLWFLGPLVGLVVVAGLVLERDRPLRDLLSLVSVPLLGIAVAAVTPIGPRLLTLPFTVNAYAEFVTEWRPPDLHEPYVAVTVGLLALTTLGWARGEHRVPWPSVLLWVMALGWTLLYARTVAIGAIVVAPLAAASLQQLLPLPEEPAARRVDRRLIPAAVVLAAVVGAVLAPSVAPRPGSVPLGLGSAIDGLDPGTVVLNDDALGGWLLLEHPGVSPVIDTRTYLFDVPYIRQYIGARGAVGDWQAFVDTTRARAALLREGEPLAVALPESLGWREVARADGYVLLTAGAR